MAATRQGFYNNFDFRTDQSLVSAPQRRFRGERFCGDHTAAIEPHILFYRVNSNTRMTEQQRPAQRDETFISFTAHE
jgi:hypothetical protein